MEIPASEIDTKYTRVDESLVVLNSRGLKRKRWIKVGKSEFSFEFLNFRIPRLNETDKSWMRFNLMTVEK